MLKNTESGRVSDNRVEKTLKSVRQSVRHLGFRNCFKT
nr:MAG TPA: hypothetical protein [Caudoviricetes sp.]